MKMVLVVAVLSAVPCFAEAGSPLSFCGQTSCSCGAATCGCGQVCNIQLQQCQSAQSGFCSSDANCAATCDSFICEGNVCVKGVRTDGGGGTTTPPPSRGCSSTGMFGVGLGLLAGMHRFRRSRSAAV